MASFYDRDGNEITFAEFLSERDNRVALDVVNSFLVSTVWLGLDHSLGEGRPLIFETMVFDGLEVLDEFTRHYSTEAEAVAGHAEIVELVKEQE